MADGKFKKDKTVKRYNDTPEGKLLTNKIEKSKPSGVTKIQYKKPKKKKSKKSKGQKRYIDTGKYKMAKEYRDVARELNKAYDEVKQSGLTNNTIKLYERTLEQFYEKHGRKVKNMHHISTQMQSLDPEVIQELADITMTFADMALEDRDFYLSDIIRKIDPRDLQVIYDKQQEAIFFNEDTDYDLFDILGVTWNELDLDKFNQIKEEYGVETIQDFVNWTDEMERYRSSSFLSEVLTSDQIAELWAYAQSGDIKVNRRTLHMMIRANYNATGKTGLDLYNIIRQKIDLKKGV